MGKGNMNYSVESYIGQKVKRTVFLLKIPNVGYHFLYGMIECPGANTIDTLLCAKNYSLTDYVKNAPGNKEKVFFSIDIVTLTDEMAQEPWKYIEIDGTQIVNECEDYQWNGDKSRIIPVNRPDNDEMMSVVPKSAASLFLKSCRPEKISDIIHKVLQSKGLKEQLKYLSEKHLGFDLNLHTKFLGNILLMCSNPVYRNIDITQDAKGKGIYVRVNYRGEEHIPLKMVVYGKDRTKAPMGVECHELDGRFLSHLKLKENYPLLDILVFDNNDFLVDYHQNINFISSISFGVSMKSKDVVLTDEKGEIVKVVEKYTSELTSVIGKKIDEKSIWDTSPEFAYDKLERSLDFVFFDGDKNKLADNQSKARDCVQRIIDQAKMVCYICDSYFNPETLDNFVLPIKMTSVEVRILSSKERLSAEAKKQMRERIRVLLEKDIANVRCKLLRGVESPLHDRFIVADNKVWMLGCSLNEFGVRASTLIRVPSQYSKKIVDWTEKYWNSDDLSDNL